MINTIVFTGGGTAGHVTPNLALIDEFKKLSWNIFYIGSKAGIEKNMLEDYKIPYYGIYCGKLRRYFTLKTLFEPFKIAAGVVQSLRILLKLKPKIVFSKGGFVAFPVVFAAWVLRIPVIAHESDITPGLANKLSYPFVKKICIAFEFCKTYFSNKDKLIVTGTPVRESLFQGKALSFDNKKTTLLFMGGSLGADSINACVRKSLEVLLPEYNIIHLCGRGKLDNKTIREGYLQIEYATDNMADLYATADIVISRSGANSVYEILALKKLNILIPLPKNAVSRGDQVENANYFKKLGVSLVLDDKELSTKNLVAMLGEIQQNKIALEAKINSLDLQSATTKIVQLLQT